MHISDLTKDEVKELGIFLRKGLGGPPGASNFADEDILLWKYFGRDDEDRPRSIVARNDKGEIVAHCGATYARFRVPVPGQKYKIIRGVFPVDWLSFQLGAGLKILKVAAANCDVIYSIGGTVDARKGLTVVKCANVGEIEFKRKFLTRSAALNQALKAEGSIVRKSARALRNLLQFRGLPSQNEITLESKTVFTADDLDLAFLPDHVQTIRSPEKMNHLLRRPRNNITAWTIVHQGLPIGYAILTRSSRTTRVDGKIVDYQFKPEYAWLHSSIINALLHKLAELGAGAAFMLSSTEFQKQSLVDNTFRNWGTKPFMMSDGYCPQGSKYYLNSFEADLGYE